MEQEDVKEIKDAFESWVERAFTETEHKKIFKNVNSYAVGYNEEGDLTVFLSYTGEQPKFLKKYDINSFEYENQKIKVEYQKSFGRFESYK